LNLEDSLFECSNFSPLWQVADARYGTFLYILRLELRKRSHANRLLVVTMACFTCLVTLPLLALAARQLHEEGGQDLLEYGHLAVLAGQLLFQLLSCYILYTESGVLLPESARCGKRAIKTHV
jgi:hypothetical protein